MEWWFSLLETHVVGSNPWECDVLHFSSLNRDAAEGQKLKSEAHGGYRVAEKKGGLNVGHVSKMNERVTRVQKTAVLIYSINL